MLSLAEVHDVMVMVLSAEGTTPIDHSLRAANDDDDDERLGALIELLALTLTQHPEPARVVEAVLGCVTNRLQAPWGPPKPAGSVRAGIQSYRKHNALDLSGAHRRHRC